MSYARFAVYFTAHDALARFGAEWLGWDVDTGTEVAGLEVPGREEATQTPRKYGFHATLKPPFRLAEGTTEEGLAQAVADLAMRLAPASCETLAITALGRFLALTPVGDARGIARVAEACVTELDTYRAPAGEGELARRRAAGLSDAQGAMLVRWGYPYVLDQFRFHMTLTGKLPKAEVTPMADAIAQVMPPLPASFDLDAISLVGERADGRFELIHRYALTG